MDPLPRRAGPRPATSNAIPHCQVDQQPSDTSQLDAVLASAQHWPSVSVGESAISVAGARALILAPGGVAGPPEAFLTGREFCHGHALGDHSLHACLPPHLADEAEAAGWAERHFLAESGQLPRTVVMLYAPRDDAERDVVSFLVRASYVFARTPARTATRTTTRTTTHRGTP